MESCSEQDRQLHNIYRYKFDKNIIDLLFEFSKIHQFENRKDYKLSWESFVNENNEELIREKNRLESLGYDGDCLDKMYKSSRYYFRKKNLSSSEPKNRRKYISTDREILDRMDEHISDNFIRDPSNFKPSEGYDDFIKENKNLIKFEIERMIDIGIFETSDIILKIKKTYKNRYFQFIHSKK